MVEVKFARAFLGALLSSFLAVTAAEQPPVNSRATVCPYDRTITGYTTIKDINDDQVAELERIIAGELEPRPPYSFVLCPNTVFDVSSAPIDILLSGTVISCGDDMKPTSSMRCNLRGGMSQIVMSDLSTPNYQLQRATVIGVTFEQFNGTAIDIRATELLTVTLMDVVWKNFYSDFVVAQQGGTDGKPPARVDVKGGVLINGFGGSLFSNDGGVLAIDQLTVSNVTCAGLVSVSNGGVGMMQSSTVSRSVIDTVGAAMVGSTLSVFNVEVYEMIYTYRAFHVQNAGSKLLLNRTKIRDFKQANIWNGVVAEDSATAILDRVEFNNNKKFENLVHARTSATVDIVDSSFDSNVGRNPASVSSAIFALMNAVVNLRRSRFADNTKLTSLVFSYMRSTVIMEQSCFFGGSAEQLAFASSDSAILPVQNFVANTVVTTTCPGAGIRLTTEQMGSQCYQEGGTCIKTCSLLADQGSCVANAARLSNPLGKNGTDANATAAAGGMTMTTVAPSAGAGAAADAGAEAGAGAGVNGTDGTGGNATTAPSGEGEGDGGTVAPTEAETDEPEDMVRIYVAWSVRNNMDIADPLEVNASGMGDAFPVFVEGVVEKLTAEATRQLMEAHGRRLEVVLVEDSAVVYDVIRVGCSFENRTTNMTDTEFTTCHEAMGRYDLMITPDEDPVAVRTLYTRETRSGIDDGTFQDVLLQVEPESPLLLGPSIDARPPEETPEPTSIGIPTMPGPAGPPSTLFPTITKPTCAPGTGARSKSKSSSKAKGSKASKGSKGVKKKGSGKMMRKHSKGRRGRNLIGHEDEETADGAEGPHLSFAHVLKDHDEGEYYSVTEHAEEQEGGFLSGIEDSKGGYGYEEEEVEVDIEIDIEEEEEIDEECEEPDYYYTSAKGSSRKAGKRSKGEKETADYHEEHEEHEEHHDHEHHAHPHTHDRKLEHRDEDRHLRDDHLPRIHHGVHKQRISDLHAEVAAELESDERQQQEGQEEESGL